jgi:3-isopropylmalate dehydrogenase
MELKVGIIKGDGIGPEIVEEAMKVLDKVGEVYGHTYRYKELLLGGASIDVHGIPLTDETVAEAKSCDAVLMGSIGGDAKVSTKQTPGGRTFKDSKRIESLCKLKTGSAV